MDVPGFTAVLTSQGMIKVQQLQRLQTISLVWWLSTLPCILFVRTTRGLHLDLESDLDWVVAQATPQSAPALIGPSRNFVGATAQEGSETKGAALAQLESSLHRVLLLPSSLTHTSCRRWIARPQRKRDDHSARTSLECGLAQQLLS